MCFAIPIKVESVKGGTALLENGKTIQLEKNIPVKRGQYVRVSGDVIVDYLSKKDGDSIRQLIAELQIHYDE